MVVAAAADSKAAVDVGSERRRTENGRVTKKLPLLGRD
jgi:hypothetical protein